MRKNYQALKKLLRKSPNDANIFLDLLALFYYGEATSKKYAVKYYMQHSTFSYGIFLLKDAFVPGKCLFESKVFWTDDRVKIIHDIEKNIKILKEKTLSKDIEL